LIPKITAVAALVLLGFLSVAEAESVRGIVASTPSSDASVSAEAPTIPGWNLFHIAHCLSLNGVLYFYPVEAISIGIQFYSTNDIVDVAAITPACQTANLVAVYSVDANTWTQFYTYTFK